ncbi:cation-translocating P-type ATPase [uncultured Clostridium sp.]|uniref:cation-translocating P-type ATPase n=1 Tax=uncultured Clostridium sp. TaxID=59620 RepID=UPI002616ECB4|nr:cation-translocating P-type ATPase [uncultured Clostridium sp.]
MTKKENFKGLTKEEVYSQQEKFGKNILIPEKKENFFTKIIEVIKEPMFLLLLVAATIYFILGEPRDGVIMLIFVIAIIGIDIFQEWKTDKTLKALKELSAPTIKVIRDGEEIRINSEDLVPKDLMIIEEGVKIPVDGFIIEVNGLCIDESSLTGEAEGVWKSSEEDGGEYFKKNYVYAGTLVTQGKGFVRVEKIGGETEYGKIGVNIVEAPEGKTPLQKQTGKLVKICAYIALVLFILVCVVTYFNLNELDFKNRIIESILSGITLAMAMIPEEFPVILTVFLSMGAWRLAKKSSLVRKLPSVETLGAVSVLCVDKTGTITMNKMKVWDTWTKKERENLLVNMGRACLKNPFDPMEKAMIQYCIKNGIKEEELFKGNLLYEYPFTNEKKIMGQVWEREKETVLSVKGSLEKILELCNLSIEEKEEITIKGNKMAEQGLRVIGVGTFKIKEKDEIKKEIEDYSLEFLGLIGLQDPPRESVKKDIENCIKAGIRVVMITGDNGVTAKAIGNQIGLKCVDCIITGDMLNKMSDEELGEKIKTVNIFSRVIPAHKMRIIKAFKESGEVVAMTGDGVNDAPALKYADIGIAMGKRGSEVSKEAADLILLDDNFSTIVQTIEDGRRIYDNIRKAIGYVFTIHIPIAFASLLGPLLHIGSSALLLLPIHVVLLELVIDPTCSIVLERGPAEDDIMKRNPRNPKENILTSKTLIKSIIQGIVLFIASFGTYYMMLNSGVETAIARSMGLSIIIVSNLLLVQVNSSNEEYAYKSFKKLKKDKVMWSVIIGSILGLGLILYTPLSKILNLTALNFEQIVLVIGISIISIMWYEVVKWIKNKMKKNN